MRNRWAAGCGRGSRWATLLATLCVSLLAEPGAAWALITGGTGNTPLARRDWPDGAAAVFDVPSRVAYWEGPPFGGGQWHAECRGDAAALNKVLADFAKLSVKNRRIVVHDGVGRSFWLNPNNEPAKEREARIDWIFMVWQPKNWELLRQFPPDLRGSVGEDGDGPPAQLDIYTGGNVKWEEVRVPEGLRVDDHRLAAHGFSTADGLVLEGAITSVDGRPLAGVARLERIETPPQGGYRYEEVRKVEADGTTGRWVFKNVPGGRHRIVVTAEGHVARVVGYAPFRDQPFWQSFSSVLAPAAAVSGQVVNEADGSGLAGVAVRLGNVTTGKAGRYESDVEFQTITDADGRFKIEKAPQGTADVWVHKNGFVRPGLGQSVKVPQSDVKLSMKASAQLVVLVKFNTTTRPAGYLVHIAPEEGEAVGRWSGSGAIDPKDAITFRDVPPGRYAVYGRPNPGGNDEQTKTIIVDLQGGRTSTLELMAK